MAISVHLMYYYRSWEGNRDFIKIFNVGFYKLLGGI